jgi:hypothetical protein
MEFTSDSKITGKIASFDEKEIAKLLEKLNNSSENLAFHFKFLFFLKGMNRKFS